MATHGIVESLAQLALFADLRRPTVETIAHSFDEQVFAPGQRVLRRDLAGGAFYVILEGEATVDFDGRPLSRLARGDFFGEISALTGDPPSADVRAETLLRCFVIPASDLEPLLLRHPSVAIRMLQAEARRLRDSNRWQ